MTNYVLSDEDRRIVEVIHGGFYKPEQIENLIEIHNNLLVSNTRNLKQLESELDAVRRAIAMRQLAIEILKRKLETMTSIAKAMEHISR